MRIKRNKTVTSDNNVERRKTRVIVDNNVNQDEIIKTVRVYEKDGMIHLDYRVHKKYRNNGAKERTRCSTGEVYSKRSKIRIERDKFSLALSHYFETTQIFDGGNLTVGDIALDAIYEGKGNRQEDTQNDYKNIYDIYIKPVFEHSLLSDIKVSHLKSWKNNLLEEHPMSRPRFVKYIRVLNFIFKYAYENEMIDRNPVALVDKKSKLFTQTKKYQGEKYYTASEVKLLLKEATGWFRVMLVTYLNTGMRTGEGLALKWSDIDFEKMTITIQRSMRNGNLKESTKTGEDRIIRMSQPLKEELLAYKDVSASDVWLFPNVKTGFPYYASNSITKYQFRPLLEKCNIADCGFYTLRHTFASLSAKNKIPMSVIQKQLGHKRLSTSMDFYIKYDLLADDDDKDIFDKLYA